MFSPYPYPQFQQPGGQMPQVGLPGGAQMPPMPMQGPQMPMGQQQNPATAGMGAKPAPGMQQPGAQQQPGGLAGMNPATLAGLLQQFKGANGGGNTNPGGLLTGKDGMFGGGVSGINWNNSGNWNPQGAAWNFGQD